MKYIKRILKVITVSLVVFIAIVAVVFGAILWPTNALETPSVYKETFIKSINIIDIKKGRLLKNSNVLIRENIIIKIDTSNTIKPSLNSFVIDGTDKYLIPGLWDMHTHSTQHSEWLHHPLYIANGVTGVRDMSGQLNKKDSYWVGSKERLQWNNEVTQNIRVSPRYVLQSSYQMDGKYSVPNNFPNFFKLENTHHVDSLLNHYKNENVDFIKIYQQIPKKSYIDLALKAPKYGIHLAGHKPIFVSLEDAINLGQKSFEHGRIFFYDCFPGADSLRTSNNWRRYFLASKKNMIAYFNQNKADSLMVLMKEKQAYWTPTLQTLKFEAYAHKNSFINNENLKYITTVRKKLWWGYDINNNREKNLADPYLNISEQFFETSKKQIKKANEIGVPIMVGTDITDSYTFAGFSLHDELYDLRLSGLSNLEVLQSATVVPANYTKLEHKFGAIEIGKMADLIILNKNPLIDIRNTKTISGVLLNGLYYNKDKIDEMKNFTQSAASSFHMNLKVFFGLFNSPLIRVQFAD